ncbi:hypothetical protein BH10BAC6_BH10BAC6_07700 [soil metagenome]
MCINSRILACAAILLWAAPIVHAQHWVDLLYGPNPNVFEVTRSYEEYWSSRPFVKSRETQDYKRWVRMMEQFADTSGFYRVPALSRLEQDRIWGARFNVRSHESEQRSTSWKSIGPFSWDKQALGLSYAPGQAHCYTVAQGVSDTSVVYVGTATAGLWKSVDNGRTWSNVTATMMVREVRSVLVDPGDARNVYFGCSLGVMHSSNGGSTWEETGLKDGFYSDLVVWDMSLNPVERSKLHVATNRGLFYSTNAGATFTKVIDGEVYEIERHPIKAPTMYVVRHTGDSCEFYKSTNAGSSFVKAGKGLPIPNVAKKEHTRRWEIAVTPAATQNVYLIAPGNIDSSDGTVGMYLSTNEGESFTMRCCGTAPGGKPDSVNVNMMCWDAKGLEPGGQYYYDLGLNVSETDANRVFVCGINVWTSNDGGSTFVCNAHWTYGAASKPKYVHADCHDIKIYGNRVWVVSDGGVFLSTNNGNSFDDMTRGIQGTEFWGWGAGFSDCNVMLGGTYHNGVLLKDGNAYDGWLHIYGGDNDGGLVNYGDARTVYANTYMGQTWHRVTLSGSASKDLARRDMSIKPTSPLIQHPRCSSELWVGADSILARSTNNGASWSTIRVTPKSKVRLVRICDGDPSTIVMMHKNGYYDNYNVLRSTDAGKSFTTISPPTALIKGNAWRLADVAISAREPNVIWISIGGNQTDAKVIRSVDGGATWENYSGTLPIMGCRALVHQRGTNRGVYLGTDIGVYYRDETMKDWVLYSDSLPVTSVTTFDICYREQKIRAATNRGVFEAPLYAAAPPMAVISADRYVSMCTRDTIVFHDHSSADESTVTRRWSLPGGVVTTLTDAHIRVVYPKPGTYSATLVVTDANGVDRVTLDSCITVLSECFPDSMPGRALKTDGRSAYATIPPMNRTRVATTISTWIRRSGQQNSFTGIVMSRGSGTIAGINLESDHTLRYHWNGDAWWLKSKLFVPDNEWTYVALVVTADSARLYCNGKSEAFAFTHPVQTFASETSIGQDPTGGRVFNGLIDEVRIYDRALTDDEIKRDMHLTNASTNDLIAYYQFNEQAGQAIDAVGNLHAMLANSADRALSTAPVGPGESERVVTTADTPELNILNMSLSWSIAPPLPANDVVLTHLRIPPQPLPTGIDHVRSGYYILRSFGANTFTTPDQLVIKDILVQRSEGSTPASLVYFLRDANSDNVWGARTAVAAEANPGYRGSARFFGGKQCTAPTQLVIASTQPAVSVLDDVSAAPRCTLSPNPATTTTRIEVTTPSTVRIYSLIGEVVYQATMDAMRVLDVRDWPAGTYYVQTMSANATTTQQLVVRER